MSNRVRKVWARVKESKIKYTTQEIDQWSGSRDTSPEIAMAIFDMARNKEEAQKIWEAPTSAQVKKVLQLAWKKTDAYDNQLFWGPETYDRP